MSIAKWRVWIQGIELFPSCLVVGDVDGPMDGGVTRRDFADQVVMRIVAVDSKTRGLPLHAPLFVFERPVVNRAGVFRTEEERRRTVAQPGNTDRWMNL